MMEYNELANGLNTFAYNLHKFDITEFQITQEVANRSIINRLYYALYNRLINELPSLQLSKTPDKHQQIEDRLKRHLDNNTCRYTYNHFRDLKSLRVWADYKPTIEAPNTNFNILLAKTYKILQYQKIFP